MSPGSVLGRAGYLFATTSSKFCYHPSVLLLENRNLFAVTKWPECQVDFAMPPDKFLTGQLRYLQSLRLGRYSVVPLPLAHCGRVTQICVFSTVKLGTSASSP